MSDHTVIMNPIRKLPISLSNQIAAGEVVERPASILKELIENSIDAGANHIRIEVQQAGLEKISVTDNGHGIPASELCLAVAPHATSKIYSQEQLGHISTLGFRGEALASIASISKFEISSRVADDDTAWKLDYSNENNASYDQQDLDKLKLIPVAHSIGTTVTANKIFYNTPARKKYLRTERTEYLHVEKIIKQLILSDFNSGFIFIHNDKEIYRFQQALDEQAQSRRVIKICGKSFYDNTVTLNFKASGMTIKGWLAKGDYSRASADIQYFYINGRIIRDRVIFHAIRLAFKDLLPEGRYVAYVLYLTINTESIDVNVHPTKHEVRFDDMRLVHDFLSHVITQGLNSTISNTKSDSSEVYKNYIPEVIEANIVSEENARYSEGSIRKKEYSKLTNSFFGISLKIVEQRYLFTEYNSSVTIIEIRKAQSFLMRHTLTQQYQTKIISKPLMIPRSISLEKKEIDTLESNINLIIDIGLDFTITGLDTILLRSIPVALTNIHYFNLFKAVSTFLVDNKDIQIDELLQVICGSDLIDISNFNNELGNKLLFELNDLDETILLQDKNIWWYTLNASDYENYFK